MYLQNLSTPNDARNGMLMCTSGQIQLVCLAYTLKVVNWKTFVYLLDAEDQQASERGL